MKTTSNLTKEDKRIVNSIFWRSISCFAGRAGGQTRQQAPGFVWTMLPALNSFYKDDKKGHTEALQRATTFYNITPYVGTFAMGLVASMEKKKSKDPDMDGNSIVALKTALMGPLSGIGDSIFWGVLRVIAAGLGLSLAANGSILGPIVFLLVFNIPALYCRYKMTVLGYSLGSTFLEKMDNSGVMKLLTKGASTLGLLMIGGMTSSMVTFKSTLSIPIKNGKAIELQQYLDSIFIGLVPLCLTLLCLYALNKRINPNLVLFGVMVLAIVLALIGIV